MVGSLLLLAVFALAWSNGANDNFKGVATLYGSGALSFRTALVLSTTTTFLGSLVSVALARNLARAFSGKGIVDSSLIDERSLIAVAGGASMTILLATVVGLPTSTTHALTGALVGTGLMAAGPGGVDWNVLATRFARPLLLSPLIALSLSALAYLGLRWLRSRAQLRVGGAVFVREVAGSVVATPDASPALREDLSRPLVAQHRSHAFSAVRSPRRLASRPLGSLNTLHLLSGTAVCFSRAVNDTPKIAALLLAAAALPSGSLASASNGSLLVAVAMATGGWLQARGVAETMSRRITPLNEGQGLTANLVTSFLVLAASRYGLPVSTTHVSCGSIFGIGLAGRCADRSVLLRISSAWISTLPLALVLGAMIYLLLT